MSESSPAAAASRPTVPLRAAAELGRSEVGAKALQLSLLLRAGFSVPDGFVVTASALARLSRDELATALGDAVAPFAGARLALRSSAHAEDSEDASLLTVVVAVSWLWPSSWSLTLTEGASAWQLDRFAEVAQEALDVGRGDDERAKLHARTATALQNPAPTILH